MRRNDEVDCSIDVEGAEVAKNVRNASGTIDEPEIARLDGFNGASNGGADGATEAAVGQLVEAEGGEHTGAVHRVERVVEADEREHRDVCLCEMTRVVDTLKKEDITNHKMK